MGAQVGATRHSFSTGEESRRRWRARSLSRSEGRHPGGGDGEAFFDEEGHAHTHTHTHTHTGGRGEALFEGEGARRRIWRDSLDRRGRSRSLRCKRSLPFNAKGPCSQKGVLAEEAARPYVEGEPVYVAKANTLVSEHPRRFLIDSPRDSGTRIDLPRHPKDSY